MNSGSWWWLGRPGVLWFMGSQRVRHNWATELIKWYHVCLSDLLHLVWQLCLPTPCVSTYYYPVSLFLYLCLFVPLYFSAVPGPLFSHTCLTPLCKSFPLLMLLLSNLSDCPTSLYISASFFPLLCFLCALQLHPFSVTLLSSPLSGTPGGDASFLLSLPSLLQSIIFLSSPNHHDALKAMVPPFILSQTVWRASSLLPPSYQ